MAKYNKRKNRGRITRDNCYCKDTKKYLRLYIRNSKWFKKNNKCYITGRHDNLEVHHCGKGFIDILTESLDELGLEFKPYVENYSTVELIQLREKVLSKHIEYCAPVTLNEGVHKELHKYYNKSSISVKELGEFKTIYMYNNSNIKTNEELEEVL